MALNEIAAKFQSHTLALGILIQFAGYYSSFRDLLSDALTALLITSAGYLLVGTYCCIRLFSKKLEPSMILRAGTERPRQTFVYSKYQRALAGALLVLATSLLALFFVSKLQAANTGRMVPVAQSTNDQGRERSSVFSMVDIYDANWTGGGAFAILEDGEHLPLAQIKPKPETSQVTFYGTSCAVSFKVEAKKAHTWVSLDQVVGEVQSYRPLPKYKAMLPAPFQRSEVLYLELSPPSNGRRSFRASRLPGSKSGTHGQAEPGFIKIEPGRPEEIIIMINSTTPGIYTFSLSLHFSSKGKKEIVPLIPGTTWLFDGREK